MNMAIREDIMYEGQQRPLKDVDINFLNHNSLKYTYARCSLLADCCPDSTFTGCFALWMCVNNVEVLS